MSVMTNILSALKEQASALGGIPLRPKRSTDNTSIAFTFHDRTAADRLANFAKSEGVDVHVRGTYHGVLFTAVLPR